MPKTKRVSERVAAGRRGEKRKRDPSGTSEEKRG